MEVPGIVKEFAIIVLVASASILCVIVIVGLVKLLPHLRRFAENLEATTASTANITGDLASVSTDVANDVRKTTTATAIVAGDLANVSEVKPER